MKTSNEIKKHIHTINPDITDELLNLLYEYVISKQFEGITQLSNNYNLYRKELNQYVQHSFSHNNSLKNIKDKSTTIDSKKVNIKGYFTY